MGGATTYKNLQKWAIGDPGWCFILPPKAVEEYDPENQRRTGMAHFIEKTLVGPYKPKSEKGKKTE